MYIMRSLLASLILLPISLEAQQCSGGGTIGAGAEVRAPYNPPPLQSFLAFPSGPLRLLLSQPGQQLRPQPFSPEAISSAPGPIISPRDTGTVAGCGTSAGTRFNLEPRTNARFQNTQAVDVLRNGAATGVDLVVGGSWDWRHLGDGSATGYYISRDMDCAPEFEGGLPAVEEFDDRGLGDPVVAVDPARKAIFMADLRLKFDDRIGIGVFRTTASTLLSSSSCPNGTHGEAQASTCWPKRILLNPVDYLNQQPQDKPHLAVDERTSGTGAGNVYVTATQFDFGTSSSEIWLVACRNDLSSCSAPTIISGFDSDTQFSHVAVRPNGDITITYINVADVGNSFDIKYVRCTPHGAPNSPSCSAPTLVHHETQPLRFGGFLGAHTFPIATYPKHDHRADTNGTETYVVWDRCKVAPINPGLVNDACVCPDADVLLKASNNNGTTWSAVVGVNTSTQDQFLPAIRTDRSRNIVNIAYYSSSADSMFQHGVQVILHHINPGNATPDPLDAHTLTTLINDPSGDPLFRGTQFSDYIGIAARGTGVDGQSRAYVHFTYNSVQGTYNGIQVPEQNNHIARIDY